MEEARETGRDERKWSGYEDAQSECSITASACAASFTVESRVTTGASGGVWWSGVREQFGPEQGAFGDAGISSATGGVEFSPMPGAFST